MPRRDCRSFTIAVAARVDRGIVDGAVGRGHHQHEVRQRRLGKRALELGLGARRLGARVLEPAAAQTVVDPVADDARDRDDDQRRDDHPPLVTHDENRELAHPASELAPDTCGDDAVECPRPVSA